MSTPTYNGLFRYDSGIRYADGLAQGTKGKTMARIALNLKGKSARDVLAKLMVAHTKLTNNNDVTTPKPALTVVKSDYDAALASVELVEKLEKDLETARANRDLLMDTVVDDYEQLASTVESETRGDPNKMIGCGFDVVSAAAPTQALTKVQNNFLTTGDDAGTGDGGWNALPGARSYEVQISPDPMTETSWQHYVTTTESKVKITGQRSGAKIWTRVRAVNRKGPGPWSDPACAMMP